VENADGWKTIEGGVLPMERPGRYWKIVEGTGEFWTHGSCLDIDG